MKATKPIPVRLPEYLIQRLDSIVDMRPGVTRAAMIRYMIETWLDYTEKNGIPSNWEEIMKRLDGRTKLSRQPELFKSLWTAPATPQPSHQGPFLASPIRSSKQHRILLTPWLEGFLSWSGFSRLAQFSHAGLLCFP
jgi:predicted DNA-binding protein